MKRADQLTLLECGVILRHAVFFGSNATHAHLDTSDERFNKCQIFYDCPIDEKLYEYVGQGTIMQSAWAVDKLIPLAQIRTLVEQLQEVIVIPAKLKTKKQE